MQTLQLIARMLGIAWCFMSIGLQNILAAEVEYEYRFERMLPNFDTSLDDMYASARYAPDGTFWRCCDDHISHFNGDGSLIGSFLRNKMFAYDFLEYLPGSLWGVNDLAFAPDGSVWVTYSDNSSIKHVNSDGDLLAEIKYSSLGISNIIKVDFALDSSIWVLATDQEYKSKIYHLNAKGEAITSFILPDRAAFAVGFATSPDGSIWVSYRDAIYHLTTIGVVISKFEPQTFNSVPNSEFTSLAVAIDGSVWLSIYPSVYHLRADGTLIQQLPEYGKLASAADGSLWLSSRIYIQHLQSGSLIAQFGYQENNPAFNRVLNMALADNDSLWGIQQNNTIQHLDNNGLLLEQLIIDTKDNAYVDISKAADGSFWLLNSHQGASYSAQHYSADGRLIKQFTTNESGQYQHANDIVAAPDGSVWVSENKTTHGAGLEQILHFSADGNLLGKINTRCNGLAIASDSSVWSVNSILGISHFTVDGKLITSFGVKGNGVGQFNSPTDIALNNDGSVWVMDYPRIVGFNSEGVFLNQHELVEPNIRRYPDFYYYPEYRLTIGKEGTLWAIETNAIYPYSRLQKFVPRPRSKAAHPYKAIILAGNTPQTRTSGLTFLNGANWQLALKANQVLQRQGFKNHEEIQFFTAGITHVDLNNNLQLDDLQAATKASLKQAITEWAKDSHDVVIYLAATGANGLLQINATETLSADELADWLAQLEKTLPGKVTVVIESPDAGSFLSALANPNRPRVVFASTQVGQAPLLADHGVNSFSYAFWTKVLQGTPLSDAFQAGQQAINLFQANLQPLQAQFDANGDGKADNQDALALGDYCLGMCTKHPVNPPVLTPLSPSEVNLKATSLDFQFKLQANNPLVETWALIQRPVVGSPDLTNPLNIEKIPMTCDTQGQCTGRYYRFDHAGRYRISFYALDNHYQLNAPMYLDVTQPTTQTLLPAEYDDHQGLVYLYDVAVNDQHYQATIKAESGLWHLQSLMTAPYSYDAPALFDSNTQVLSIPAAYAYGQTYQASFKWVDNLSFRLLEAHPK